MLGVNLNALQVTFAQRLFYVVWAGEQLAAIRHEAGQVDVALKSAAVPNAGFQGDGWTGAGLKDTPAEMRRSDMASFCVEKWFSSSV